MESHQRQQSSRKQFLAVDLGKGKGVEHIFLSAIESILSPDEGPADRYTIRLISGRTMDIIDTNDEIGDWLENVRIYVHIDEEKSK